MPSIRGVRCTLGCAVTASGGTDGRGPPRSARVAGIWLLLAVADVCRSTVGLAGGTDASGVVTGGSLASAGTDKADTVNPANRAFQPRRANMRGFPCQADDRTWSVYPKGGRR